MNINGSAWQPSARDRICSHHFVSGEKSDNPTHPGYIPTLNMAEEDSTTVASTAEQSVSRVERWSAREERKCHQFEEEEAAQVASISVRRRIVSIEHSYPSANMEPPTKLTIPSEDSISLPSLELKSTG